MPRPSSADGPPGAPWGPFIRLRLRPAGAPHPATRGGGPVGPAPGRTRSRRAPSPARLAGPLCPAPPALAGVHPSRPGKSWGLKEQGRRGAGRGRLFPEEETGALQQEGLWEDESP